MQETSYGDRHKIDIRWQIDERDLKTQKRFLVMNWYTLSLHKKATLRQHLEAWRGRKFKPEELKGFDLEKLLGANCQLQIIHTESDTGRTYANIQAIVPLSKDMEKMISEDYIRFQDREDNPAKPAPEKDILPEADDDLPF